MIIRAARNDEALTLTQLAFDSKRYWGYDDDFMERCRSELVVREEDITQGNVFVSVDETDGDVTGVYILKTLSDSLAELDMLFVAPPRIGDGVGAALVAHAIDLARATGHATMRIDADPFAAAFYEHQGAVLVGTSTSVSTGRELPTYEFRL
ncbi:MAG: GNAT family N-acetyltransferase [Acidimicrobiales bacterium]